MILCCGEALIDMIPRPTVDGADGFVPHPGGAVFNTAIGLGRLEQRVGLLTGLSSDMFGQQLEASLTASNVDTSPLIRSDRPTTLAFVQLTDGHANYVFYDEGSAGLMLDIDDMPRLPDDVTTLYFGGISLVGEPAAEAYALLLDREGADRAVMLDPNIRPGFIQDEGRYRDRLTRMIAKADIVKVSDEDLNWIDPRPLPLQAKIEAMLTRGPSLVILTKGSDGVIGYTANGGRVAVPAQRVTVVDTVGAGDTFNAGVLAKLSELGALSKRQLAALPPNSLEEALAFGAKVAAITVSRAGANPPWLNEL